MKKQATVEDVLKGRARWCVIHGECAKVLAGMPDKSVAHVITDPPYSAHVHSKNRRMVRGAGGRKVKPNPKGGYYRQVGLAPLDFAALEPKLRELCGLEFARLCRRWCLCFTNAEGQSGWEVDLEAGGLKHIRVGAWIKIGAQPQLTGDRPGTGFEAIEIAHGKDERCRWNNGGHHAVWHHAIATDRNGTGDRVHTTQKPLSLMLDLVTQFTDVDEVVLDVFAGGASTGVACVRLGRKVILVERDKKYAKIARERMEAESRGLSLRASRSGQGSIFDLFPVAAGGKR